MDTQQITPPPPNQITLSFIEMSKNLHTKHTQKPTNKNKRFFQTHNIQVTLRQHIKCHRISVLGSFVFPTNWEVNEVVNGYRAI